MIDTSILKKVYLFDSLSPTELESLMAIVKEKDVIAGDYIFSEGRPATSLYIIRSGTVELLKKGTEDEARIATFGVDSHFGEMAFFDPCDRTASAIAKENTKLLEVEYSLLTRLLDDNRDLNLKICRTALKILCKRIRQTTSDLSSLKELKLKHT